MSLVEKLSSAVLESAKTISSKSSNMVEISKMNLSIRKREKEIEKLFIEIGEYVYIQLQRKQIITAEEIQIQLKRIGYLQQDVDTLEKLLFKIQDIRACDYCKEVFDQSVSYCPFCGKNIKE